MTLTLVSHDLCPYVQRAVIALTEKGVASRRVTIDLADKPDWFRAVSPLGKVPLLRVEAPDRTETFLFESNAICEYIEETQTGPALHPADPLERARHWAWIEFGSAILADIWGLETTRDPETFEAKLGRIEGALGDGPFFAESRFSLVDAVFGPVFRYFDLFDTLADLCLVERCRGEALAGRARGPAERRRRGRSGLLGPVARLTDAPRRAYPAGSGLSLRNAERPGPVTPGKAGRGDNSQEAAGGSTCRSR